MSARLSRALACLLLVSLLVRSLIPVGFMPVSLASGAPVVLCPIANPELADWLRSVGAGPPGGGQPHPVHEHASHEAGKDGAGAGTLASTLASCAFAGWLVSLAPPPFPAEMAVPAYRSGLPLVADLRYVLPTAYPRPPVRGPPRS